LSPTLTDTTYRQWRQPLVTGTLEELSLEVMYLLRLNWKNKFWWLRSSKLVTAVQRVAALRTFEKTALLGGFFFSAKEDYDDDKKISSKSVIQL